jgi:hypothetical protein
MDGGVAQPPVVLAGGRGCCAASRGVALVKTDSGRWRARTVVSGRHAFVTKLFVATDESGAFPKVLFVDVYGEEVRSGAAVREHIEKK